MLTELISRNEEHLARPNGNGHALEPENGADEDDEDGESLDGADGDDDEELEDPVADDPGAKRRFRFRHPTASGKTIAAGGLRGGGPDDGRS